MKIKYKLVIIVLVLLLSVSFSYAEVGAEGTIEATLMQFEYLDKIEATFIDENLVVKMNLNYMNNQLLYNMVNVIEQIHSIIYVDQLTLEVYDNYLPYMSIVTTREDIFNYMGGTYDINTFIETFDIKDTRSIEKKLYDDLNIFDSYVNGIEVNKNSVTIKVEYIGDEEEFLNEYYAMALTSLEDAPWISSFTISYEDSRENLLMIISSTSKDILDVINGDITKEEFISNLDIKIGTTLDSLVNENDESINDNSENDSSTEITATPTSSEEDTFQKYNVADAKIIDTLSSGGISNMYELEVNEDGEYYFTINNFDNVPLALVVADKNLDVVKNNRTDTDILDYLYVDLSANQTYYLLVMPQNNEDYGKELSVTISESTGIMGFLIGVLVVFALIIFGLVILVKKIMKK